jgi:alkanesulfonate monooxygenase SsuD/methylene tetrahydromethanopterin reductase-like flavin-dependent oxidoreductase (luciferase family)
MHYGFLLPAAASLTETIQLTKEGEEAGWDGIFYGHDSIEFMAYPLYDPWLVMTAQALSTQRVRLGTFVMPLARRRPWKVAREALTLDHLSHGRLILSVGLGAVEDGGFRKVGEPLSKKVRAELLDESLSILTGLWSGKPFSFEGKHYHLQEMTFLPTPVQQRLPIWVVGGWKSEKSMARALRYDGVIPQILGAAYNEHASPEQIRAIKDYVHSHRQASTPFDILAQGQTHPKDRKPSDDLVASYQQAGATWWIEDWYLSPVEEGRKRLQAGPQLSG